jgi:CP family cyanate transporter-like MFS transporter
MSSVLPSTGRRHLLLIIGILLIASTLRVTFTGAAPLLDAIRADYGLSTAQTGMLTTLPLLAFGLVSRWRQASGAGWALNAACWRR